MWPKRKQSYPTERGDANSVKDSTSLYSMLLEFNRVSTEELKEAVDIQKKNKDKYLGQILVSLGLVEKNVIDTLLALQNERRENRVGLKEIVNLSKLQDKRVEKANVYLLREIQDLIES